MAIESALLGRLAPAMGPLASNIQEIAAGSYTDIIDIIAPSEAAAGDQINVEVKIKNLHTSAIYIGVTGRYDSNSFAFSPEYASVPAGATYSFTYSFTMPNNDIRLHVWSFYWSVDGWYQDDYEYVDIRLPAGWQQLDMRSLALRSSGAPPAGWQLLDSRALAVMTSVPPPGGWQLLDSRTLSVMPTEAPPAGWTLLDSTMVGVSAGPPAEIPWQLVYEHIYYWGYVYQGPAEVCEFTFKFPPDWMPGIDWLTETLVEMFASTLEDNDSKLLELKLWSDPHAMWTDYKCQVTASSAAVSGRGIAALPWWGVMLIVMGVILAVTWAIRETWETIFSPSGLPEEVKQEWPREHLINSIIYTSPETPPETLEGMSDEELRTLLNQLLEEREKGISWWWVALIGGLAVGGTAVGISAYRAISKPKEAKPEEE